MPTSRLGSSGVARPASASDRAVGPILAAQPQVRARPVSVFFLKNAIVASPIRVKYRFFSLFQYFVLDAVC